MIPPRARQLLVDTLRPLGRAGTPEARQLHGEILAYLQQEDDLEAVANGELEPAAPPRLPKGGGR